MKDHDQYLRELRRQRYIITRRPRSNHVRIFCPHGCMVGVHSVNGGSDMRRALANLKAEVRRHAATHERNDDVSIAVS